MSDCTHNCSTCGESCSERTAESLLAQANPGSHVKKVIAVVSGKGGVEYRNFFAGHRHAAKGLQGGNFGR